MILLLYLTRPSLHTLMIFCNDFIMKLKKPKLTDSNDVLFPCPGMTDFVLETEVNTASINFEDSSNVFLHSGMDDYVLGERWAPSVMRCLPSAVITLVL